jgi:hypothetical protein
MRVKTSATPPAERAARALLALHERQSRDTRDREIIGRNVDALNREAADALAFQRLK